MPGAGAGLVQHGATDFDLQNMTQKHMHCVKLGPGAGLVQSGAIWCQAVPQLVQAGDRWCHIGNCSAWLHDGLANWCKVVARCWHGLAGGLT